MYCIMCDNKRPLKLKKLNKVKYKECGLDNITLSGVGYYKCNNCGEEYYSYGDQEKLHSKIADTLIDKSKLLNGKEARFLRTYLGYSTEMFAELTGYTRETISRYENEKSDISKKYDVLIRSLAVNKLPNRDYDIHDKWIQEEGKSYNRINLKEYRGEWSVTSAA